MAFGVVQESDTEKRARWETYFQCLAMETRAGSLEGHKFGRFFATDGISVSVKMTRLVVRLQSRTHATH